MVANQLLSVVAIRSFDYFVTEAPQHADGKMPYADVVFEHEDRLRAGRKFVRSRFLVGWSGRRRDFRQKNSYGRAFAEFAFHADVPAALPDDSVARRETESAAAFVFRGEERLEEMLLHFVGHATAVIGDTDPDVIAGRQFLRVALVIVRWFHRDGGRFQRETAAVRHRVARVHDEVQNDLGKLAGIDLGVHAVFAALEIALHGNVFAQQAQERPLEIRQQRVHIHDRRRKRMFAAEREKLAGQRGGARRGPADLADVFRDLAFHFQLIEQ